MGELTDEQKKILDFERRWYKYDGVKEGAVLHELGIKMTVYYARLNLLLDDEAALAYDPVTVNRLRRIRDEKRAARTR